MLAKLKSSRRYQILALVLLFLLVRVSIPYANICPPGVSAAPVEPPEWQQGVSIRSHGPDHFGNDAFKASLDHLATTHTNFVTLIIDYEQGDLQASGIRRAWNTPDDDALVEAITYAHTLGFSVNLKPHMELSTSTAWRAHINAADRPAWFASYGNMLNHYAEIAEEHGVEMITVGAELIRMAGSHEDETNEQFWRELIADVRERYSGALTYSANWGGNEFLREKNHIQFWDALDYIGIAAFYNFDPPFHEDSLRQQWDDLMTEEIAPLQEEWDMPVIFSEIGYRSAAGALARPWDWEMDDEINEEEQALGYQALFSYWQGRHPWMQGVHLWEWVADPEVDQPTDYTPQGKLAEEVMRLWFGGDGEASEPVSEQPLTGPVTPPRNAAQTASGRPGPVEAGGASQRNEEPQRSENRC